ncbi:MAG: hypothetical protein P4L33_11930 [Capsulimonadaceae bacterium]|nr:hypothetical protein [Capsulimonadaceae bacterium]
MICSGCGATMEKSAKFCSQCGEKASSAAETLQTDENGAFPCSRHPKVRTLLRCGRCETPICPRCSVYTPAGVRCRDCARNRIPIRPLGLLHGAGTAIENGASSPAGRRVWYIALWLLLIAIFRGHDDS